MEITIEEAYEKLINATTQEAVEKIINDLSVYDPNDVTVLFSGTGYAAPADITAYRYIQNTDAFEFIDSNRFNNAIANMILKANPDVDALKAYSLAKDYINGVEKFENFIPTGIEANGTAGPAAIVSYNFAVETKGPVIACIGNNIDDISKRILMNTELPGILESSNATSINGISIDLYKNVYNHLSDQVSHTDALFGELNIIKNVPFDNTNPNYLDNVVLRIDWDNKSISSIDMNPVVLRAGGEVNYSNILFDGIGAEIKLGDLNDLISRTDGEYDKAFSVFEAAGYDSYGALRVLDATNNNHTDTVKLLEAATGDADGALKVFKSTDNNAGVASAVLNANGHDVAKSLNSIDEANRYAISYINDNGTEIGHSYKNTSLENILPDSIPSDYKYSIKRSDMALLPDESAISGKIPMFDKLSGADKIQLRDIERRRINGEIPDGSAVRIDIDAGGGSKVQFETNRGNLSKNLDPGEIRFDIDSSGKIAVTCRDLPDHSAAWKLQVNDIIWDENISTINGVDRIQFSKLDDALRKIDNPVPSHIIGDAIADIPYNNTNGMRLASDTALGRNKVADSIVTNSSAMGKLGAGVGASLATLDLLGDFADIYDAAMAFDTFANEMKYGDYNKACYDLGEWGYKTIGGTCGGMAAGQAASVVIAALEAAGCVVSGPVGLGIVIGTSVLGGTIGTELGEVIWEEVHAAIYGDKYHPRRAMITAALSNVGIRVNDGDNFIEGGKSDDDVIGGAGNDWLSGRGGSDSYIFERGDGYDEIEDRGNEGIDNDRIVFKGNITPSNVEIERWHSDMILSYGSNDKIVVKGAYATYDRAENLIESVKFSDGTVWNLAKIEEVTRNHLGTDADDELLGFSAAIGYNNNEIFRAGAGNDRVKASNGDDEIYGEAGSDALYGEWGSDRIIGGRDNDYLSGGKDSDTYIFNIGDGIDIISDDDSELNKDRIWFGVDINASDVRLERVKEDLMIQYSDKDLIKVEGAYKQYSDGRYFVEHIEFADGTVWDEELIANKANIHIGTEESDSLNGYGKTVGYNNDEIFAAGSGDDWIRAGDGNDTVFGDDGDDVIYGEAGDDTLSGGAGNDHISGDDGNDVVDGGEGKDKIYGDMGDDLLYGGDDNDELYGNRGDDTLNGGRGVDLLEGGEGDDMYVFELGDGYDVIYEWFGEDGIVFGEGIRFANAIIDRIGDNLEIKYSDTDKIVVAGAYNGYCDDRCFLENIEFSDGTVLDKKAINREASIRYGSDADEEIVGYNDFSGYDVNEILFGLGGDDKIWGYNGNDTIFGGDGDDDIYGGTENDTLIGETGDDCIEGGEGDDTYIFNLRDGNDLIYEWFGSDRIVFGENINFEDVIIDRRGEDLDIKYSATDGVIVKGAYNGYCDDRCFLETIEFSDGTVLDKKAINREASIRYGSDAAEEIVGYNDFSGYDVNEILFGLGGDDKIWGYNGNDTIFGGDGDDDIYGGTENDTLIGETGDDCIEGGEGDDTYIFNLRDGNDLIYEWFGIDRIVFGEGINFQDVIIDRRGEDLDIKYSDMDSVVVKGAYNGYCDDRCFLENIEFSDGTILDKAAVNREASIRYGSDADEEITGYNNYSGYDVNEILYGLGGDDTIYGYNGNDTIFGGEGDDSIYGGNEDDTLIGGTGNDHHEGGEGNDTYIFSLGDGKDTIAEWYGADKIVFTSGIRYEDIRMEKKDNNLSIRYSDEDVITVTGIDQERREVEQLELEDFALYTINYQTVSLDLVEAYESSNGKDDTENDAEESNISDIDDASIEEIIADAEETDTSLSDVDGTDTVLSDDEEDTLGSASGDQTEEIIENDNESAVTDDVITPHESSDIDSVVSEITDTEAESDDIESLVAAVTEAISESEPEEEVSDSSEYDDSDIDNMVSLAVQEMSESSGDNVSDSEDSSSSDSDSGSEELWAED